MPQLHIHPRIQNQTPDTWR